MSKQYLISEFLSYARPLILEYFDPDSCIASTRVTIETMKYFGLDFKPLVTQALVFNKPAWTHFRDNELEVNDMEAWGEIDGSWSVGLGFPPNKNYKGFVGHLIAHSKSLSIIIDCSLDQATRPKHGIIVKPMAFTINKELFEKGNVFTLDDTVLFYRTMINPTFQSAPDWKLESKWRPIVTECINYLKDIEGERE